MWPITVTAALLLGSAVRQGAASTQEQDYCRATDPNPFINFGTRAPYDASRPHLDDTTARLPGCKPVQLWLLSRHGTRYGKGSDIELITLRLPKLQKQVLENKAKGHTVRLCDADYENLRKWHVFENKYLAYLLTPQGQEDVQHMGERFLARYPELFDTQSPVNFKFMHDESKRCKASSRWFFKGIYGRFPVTGERSLDPLPDFYDKCPAYLTSIAVDFVSGGFNKFRKGAEYSDVVRRVSSRLGFYHNLDVDDIDAMYTSCSFELARVWDHGKLSPWCAVFGPEDFEVLEYWYDMKEFYRTGYGHKIHEKLGCVPIKDLVKRFSERVGANSATPPSGAIYHSHDTLLNQVVAFFGLYRDSVKMRETTFDALRDRRWRVTDFSPFASNIHAVLHECSGTDRYRVQMYLNENLLPLSDWGCDPESCTWTQFMDKFGHVLTDCKQRRLCWGI